MISSWKDLFLGTDHCIFELYSVHCWLYSVNYELYSVPCELYSGLCELYSVQLGLYIVQCEQYTEHCELYSELCGLLTVQCAIWAEKYIMWSAQYTLWAVQFTLYSLKTYCSALTWNIVLMGNIGKYAKPYSRAVKRWENMPALSTFCGDQLGFFRIFLANISAIVWQIYYKSHLCFFVSIIGASLLISGSLVISGILE